jgi:hypothetical protein
MRSFVTDNFTTEFLFEDVDAVCKAVPKNRDGRDKPGHDKVRIAGFRLSRERMRLMCECRG